MEIINNIVQISTTKFYKLLLDKFNYDINTNQLKIYNKQIFNYPNNHISKSLQFDSHTVINKYTIDNYINSILTDKKYKNCKLIHPYLLGLAWDKIKNNFRKKHCLTSKCYELNLKSESKKLNFHVYTRELIKIIMTLLSITRLKEHFNEYYNYLLSDKGILIEEKYLENNKRCFDIKIFFDEKIYLILKFVDDNKELDKNKNIDYLLKNNTIPIYYNYEKQDMTNLIPKILKEFCYAIAKKDIFQAVKFHLIMIDNLEPFFVNFSVDNYKNNNIDMTEIKETLEEVGMERVSKFIKTLMVDGLLTDEDIEYEGKDILNGTISDYGCDIIFMRLDNKYFKTKENIAHLLCRQYSIIKQKYIFTIKNLLLHNQNHYKLILENRNKIYQLYENIEPVNNIVIEMNQIFYQIVSEETREEIKEKLEIELHPKYMFLVRQNGSYMDGNNFKKITKKIYHATEESSNNICNYRWMKLDEWEDLKDYLNNKI